MFLIGLIDQINFPEWLNCLNGFIIRVLFHSCWRNPSVLSLQQHWSLIFGNMAPVWTYSLVDVILPMSFWWSLCCLRSCGAPLYCVLVYLLSFSHKTCPVHWCLLAQIWWIMSVTPVFEWIQLALFLSCSVISIIIPSILHCVVIVFCSCVLLRDHVSLPYMITRSPTCQKLSNQGLFCISTLVLDHDLLSLSVQGRCSCWLLWSSFHQCCCPFC